MRRLVPTALLASSALLLAGCATSGTPAGASSSAAGAGGEGLSIVATATVVADFTRNIVGGAASVTQLLQPNQSSHSYDPSAADLTALGTADVLVVNGAGLEEWLDDAIRASGFDGTLIDSSEGIELAEGAEEQAEEEGEEHEHAEDPHIWTDPANALVQVQNIAEGLIEADEANADAFAQNAEDYEAKLTALSEWVATSIERVPAEQRLLVTNHDAFGYFISAYGITYVGAVIPSLDDNAEVSAAEIDDLVQEIENSGAKAVFSETSLSPAAAETIANEAGVAVYAGEDALYADSLGPEGSSGATYIDSIEHNVTLLVQSWGAEPTPLPEVLSQ